MTARSVAHATVAPIPASRNGRLSLNGTSRLTFHQAGPTVSVVCQKITKKMTAPTALNTDSATNTPAARAWSDGGNRDSNRGIIDLTR